MKVLWKLGVATPKEVVPTSHCVKTDDSGEYRRNRRMLLKSIEPDHVAEDIFAYDSPSKGTRNS